MNIIIRSRKRENWLLNHFLSRILLLAILVVSGCEINPTEPSFSGLYRRDFIFEKDILKRAGVDLDDFKTDYSFEELDRIISTVNEDLLKNHKSIIVDDDLIYVNIHRLAYYSYDVLEGIVKSVTPEWSSGYPSTIETMTVLEVSKSYKTNVDSGEIVIRDIGGCIDSLCTIVFHDMYPTYQVGEKVLVFLGKWDDSCYTYSGAQGKFRIITP